MKRLLSLIPIIIVSFFILLGCEKEKNDEKGPKVETLSANKESSLVIILSGRISGLEAVALDFECGIEYSTDENFDKAKTTRIKANVGYSEKSYSITPTNIFIGQKYYYRAYYISENLIHYGATKTFILELELDGVQAIDLGLSVKWASCNVGANEPWEYGDLYSWGEVETKSEYYWDTYKFYNNGKFTKYNSNSDYGIVDNKNILEPEDDVAHVKWGGNWRMPTLQEQVELMNNCSWTWTVLNGINGYLVVSNKTGYTDRFIFLPASGYGKGTAINNLGSRGRYWSSSLGSSFPNYADHIYFNSGEKSGNSSYRFRGHSVRPVCP